MKTPTDRSRAAVPSRMQSAVLTDFIRGQGLVRAVDLSYGLTAFTVVIEQALHEAAQQHGRRPMNEGRPASCITVCSRRGYAALEKAFASAKLPALTVPTWVSRNISRNLAELVTCRPEGSYDLVFIGSYRHPKWFALSLAVATTMLREGGWLIVPTWPRVWASRSRTAASKPQSYDLASEITSRVVFKSGYFCELRQKCDFHFAQRSNAGILTPDQTRETVELRDLLLRAQWDPEFRIRLLHPTGDATSIARWRFQDTDSLGPLPSFLEADGRRTVPLDLPGWEVRHSEHQLLKMLCETDIESSAIEKVRDRHKD